LKNIGFGWNVEINIVTTSEDGLTKLWV